MISSVWFLNAHRLQTLEKIVCLYLANYNEIYEQSENQESQNLIVSMKNFERIILSY
jgi:hypothetical protein